MSLSSRSSLCSGDLAWRLSDHGARAAAPVGAAALSLAAAVAAGTGGFLGGKLVFSHGIGVREGRAGDKNLPEAAAGHDHGQGAQDAQAARAAAAGPAAAVGGRRRRLR